jgi:hypothetical protein
MFRGSWDLFLNRDGTPRVIRQSGRLVAHRSWRRVERILLELVSRARVVIWQRRTTD